MGTNFGDDHDRELKQCLSRRPLVGDGRNNRRLWVSDKLPHEKGEVALSLCLAATKTSSTSETKLPTVTLYPLFEPSRW